MVSLSDSGSLKKASSRLGLGAIGRASEREQEDDPEQRASEVNGVQELGRAYAGLVITQAALRRVHRHKSEAKSRAILGRSSSSKRIERRRRASVEQYLNTHT